MSTVYKPLNMLRAPGSRMEIICVDLDSTLADTRQRRSQCPTIDPGSDWSRYAMLCGADAPIAGTVYLVRILHAAGYGIHIVSNRPSVARVLTEKWLARNNIPYQSLRLRSPDELVDADIKLRYITEIRERGYDPLLFIEDWPATAAQIEELGVPVLCVNPRYADA